jgi:hypothetical protein
MKELLRNCHTSFPKYFVQEIKLNDLEKTGLCRDYSEPLLRYRNIPLLDSGLIFFGSRLNKRCLSDVDKPKRPSMAFLSELSKEMLFNYPDYRYGIGKTLDNITGKHNVPYIWFYSVDINI